MNRRIARWAAALGISLAVAMIAAPAASAGEELDRAYAALQSSPVFIHPLAEGISPSAQQALLDELRPGDHIYVAAVPASALAETGGDPAAFARALGTDIGGNVILVVAAGNQLAAVSSPVLPSGKATQIAANLNGGDPQASLTAFIQQVHAAQTAAAQSQTAASQPPASGGGSSLAPVGIGGVAVAVAAVAALWYVKRRRAVALSKSQPAPVTEIDAEANALVEKLTAQADEVAAATSEIESLDSIDRAVLTNLNLLPGRVRKLAGLLRKVDRTSIFTLGSQLSDRMNDLLVVTRQYRVFQTDADYKLRDPRRKDAELIIERISTLLQRLVADKNELTLTDFEKSLVALRDFLSQAQPAEEKADKNESQ